MPLTREMMREAGSKAFFALKSRKFYESKTEGSLTTLSLFGDAYRFFFDSERKIAWMKSKHHYQQSNNFKLITRHKEWEGVFSYPREVVHEEMNKVLKQQGVMVTGLIDAKKLGTEYRIVACQAYNANKRKLARIFGGVLWKHLDREVACLTMRIYGLGASALDYSIVMNNKEEILDTLQKAPAVLPVWRNVVLVKMIEDRKISSPIPEEEAEADEDDFFSALLGESKPYKLKTKKLKTNDLKLFSGHPGYLASSFNYPEEATTFVFPNIIQTTKKHLEEIGLTPVGWRYLLKMSPRIVQMIITPVGGGKDFVQLINWLAAIGVVPRQSLVKPLLRNVMHIDRSDDLMAVMRAALTHAQGMRRGVKNFFQDQMHLVLDWFTRSGPERRVEIRKEYNLQQEESIVRVCRHVQLDSNQRKSSWDWFMRQQQAWHHELNAAESAQVKNKNKNETWESAIPEIVLKKKYKVIPLNNTYALIDEGKDMHHCVGSYSRSCLDNSSRIFSIRGLNGSRMATLELRNTSAHEKFAQKSRGWVVNQCRGVCNDDVSEEVKKVAQDVANKYNKAIGESAKLAQKQEEAIAV